MMPQPSSCYSRRPQSQSSRPDGDRGAHHLRLPKYEWENNQPHGKQNPTLGSDGPHFYHPRLLYPREAPEFHRRRMQKCKSWNCTLLLVVVVAITWVSFIFGLSISMARPNDNSFVTINVKEQELATFDARVLGGSWLPYTERPFDVMLQDIWAKDDNCRKLAEYLREKAKLSEHRLASKYVHTELLIKRSKEVDPRKEQLPILSFLLTQPVSLILNILVSDRETLDNPPEWLAILRDHEVYGKRIQLQFFDPVHETDQLPLSDKDKSSIKNAHENVKELASISDIRRYSVLYSKGGIWFDTDTIFLNSVMPLMGVDAVTLTRGEFFNNAVVSTSSPNSAFMKQALETAASMFRNDPHSTNRYQYGPTLFGNMRNDFSIPMPFKALPGCLVDTSWVGGFKGGFGWDEFFDQKATDENIAFLLDKFGAFSFHWHGRWKKAIQPGSSASIAHAHYVRELGLDPTKFQSADEANLATLKTTRRAHLLKPPTELVSCGYHKASTCADCPQGNGAAWCNDDCFWSEDSGGMCQPRSSPAAIPKRVVQMYSDISKIPSKVYENIEEFAPGWVHLVYDDSNATTFLHDHFPPEVAGRFNSLKEGAHKADLFRYAFLYIKGGLWLDVDASIRAPLNEILAREDTLISVAAGVDIDTVFQGILAAPPKNNLMKFLLNQIVGNEVINYQDIVRWMGKEIMHRTNTTELKAGEELKSFVADDSFIYLFRESCSGDTSDICPRLDRYGLCCLVYDNGNAVFNSRYPDYLW